ncbi:MAG: sigma-70 family RNA polymerase sigma factor [Polyangiaceae bacterium]
MPKNADSETHPSDPRTDAELVEAVARGERAAFEAVWDRHSRLVRGVLVGAIGPDPATEDLAQEVFLAFLRGAQRIEDGAALRAYLVGVAVRLAALELRRRKAKRWLCLSASGDLPEQPIPAGDTESRETLRALERVLARLGARRRLAFVLRRVQGLSMLEVVAALGISESTLRRELRRAEQQLSSLCEHEPALLAYLGRGGSMHDPELQSPLPRFAREKAA